MRITITCPKCKKNCSLVDEKKFIKLYGKCNKCCLEEQLGKPYVPRTFDCDCGRQFLTIDRLKKHLLKFKDHKANE